MGKQWYMWYTSNWNNSDRVFELNLAERGLYRELIDRAMHNDNVVPFDLTKMARRLNSNPDELTKILAVLIKTELVIEKENGLFLPECETRLNLIRGGRKGGKKSRKNKPINKPTLKPINKPINKPIPKPTPNQRKEKERKEKETQKKGVPFELFWNAYGKKINRPKAQKKWESFSEKTQNKILAHVSKYVLAQPDKKYRKDPMTYFNNEAWNDEIIGDGMNNKPTQPTPPVF